MISIRLSPVTVTLKMSFEEALALKTFLGAQLEKDLIKNNVFEFWRKMHNAGVKNE